MGKCTLYRVHHVAKYLLPTWKRATWVSVYPLESTLRGSMSETTSPPYLEENYLGKCTLYRVHHVA
jgi:hypothetical protein